MNPTSSEEHTEQPPALLPPLAHLPSLSSSAFKPLNVLQSSASPPLLLDGFDELSPSLGLFAKSAIAPKSRPVLASDSIASTAASRLAGSGSLLSANQPANHLSPSTPYWWRPHLAKLPTLKQQQISQTGQNGVLRPAYAGQATGLDINSNTGSQDSPSLISLHSQMNNEFAAAGTPNIQAGDRSNSNTPATPKTGTWLLVVGGVVAVVVAFLIVFSLFACTNYLFFPPKRKSGTSTSGSSGTGTLPLNGLRSQLIGTPGVQQSFLGHQYQMQTHLQYTQPHYEYPLQHTIIK